MIDEGAKGRSTGKFADDPILLFDDQPLRGGTNPAMLSRKAGIGYGPQPYDQKIVRA
jgi:hypothetical protein